MHKNWNAISQIPDTHVMWALALLDMDSDLGRKFVERFPEYFTTEESAWPVPLSVLVERAKQYTLREYGAVRADAGERLWSHDGIMPWMPVRVFAKGQGLIDFGKIEGVRPVSKELEGMQKVGASCFWEGKQWTLVEYYEDEVWAFVPAELIAADR